MNYPSMEPARLHIYPNLETLSQAAAELFVERARQAVNAHGRFSVALSGGSTPRRTYELLAQPPYRDQVNWLQVQVFWGDERCVPLDDPRSNARLAQGSLLAFVPIPRGQIHPILCHHSPQDAAEAYEVQLRKFFGEQPSTFDLVFLGLGEDGHTASLFPGDAALAGEERWVAAVHRADQDLYRVTLTPAVFNRARTVAFLVAGRDKARVVQEVLEGEYEPERLPAQLIRPKSGELLWLADEAAAELVNNIHLLK
jgi:6-phosphogluconolactonase